MLHRWMLPLLEIASLGLGICEEARRGIHGHVRFAELAPVLPADIGHECPFGIQLVVTSIRWTSRIIQLAKMRVPMPLANDGVRSNRSLKAPLRRRTRSVPKPCIAMVMATSVAPQIISSNEVTWQIPDSPTPSAISPLVHPYNPVLLRDLSPVTVVAAMLLVASGKADVREARLQLEASRRA